MKLIGTLLILLLLAFETNAQRKIDISILQVTKFDAEVKRRRNFGFSAAGKYIWISDDHSNLSVWSSADHSLVFQRANIGPRISLDFSNDDKLVVLSTKERSEVLNAGSGRIIATLEGKPVMPICWIDDTDRIAAWIDRYTIGFFGSNDGRLKDTLLANERKSEWRDLSVSPDSKWILTTNDFSETSLWEAASKKLIRKFESYKQAKFSPDSHYLGLFFGRDSSNAAEVQLFDLQTRALIKILPKYAGQIVEWSPDSQQFITDRTWEEVSKNEAVIWRVDGTRMATIKTYSKHCFDFVSTCISDYDRFQFKPDGRLLMVSNKKSVRFLDPNNGSLIHEAVDLKGPAYWIPNGDLILAVDRRSEKLVVWKIKMQ
jgi:WD40 repeat protein